MSGVARPKRLDSPASVPSISALYFNLTFVSRAEDGAVLRNGAMTIDQGGEIRHIKHDFNYDFNGPEYLLRTVRCC